MPVTVRLVYDAWCDECGWTGDDNLYTEFTGEELAAQALDEHTREEH